MPARGTAAALKSRVRECEAEYGSALAFLKAPSESTGEGDRTRWFATLAKFPEVSERLVRAHREYAAALEGKAREQKRL
jgi:hypothetical protein